MKLSQLSNGARARVVDVNAPIFLRRRIFELGCCPDAEIVVLSQQRKSIGGIYAVAGVALGIKKNVAEHILVEEI